MFKNLLFLLKVLWRTDERLFKLTLCSSVKTNKGQFVNLKYTWLQLMPNL